MNPGRAVGRRDAQELRGGLAGGLGASAAFGGRGALVDGVGGDVRQTGQGLRAGAGGDDAGALLADAGQGLKGAGDARGCEPGVELGDAQPVDVEQVEDGEGSLGVVAQELGLVEVVRQVVGVLVGVVVGGGFGGVAARLCGGVCVGVGLGHGQLFGGCGAVSAAGGRMTTRLRTVVGGRVCDGAHGRRWCVGVCPGPGVLVVWVGDGQGL